MSKYSVFWGCTIPARLPNIEKATRVVLDELSTNIVDVDGFTCCPEGVLTKANSEDAFYAAAARNMAVMERAGNDVITPCNGCYSTFKETQSHLATSWRDRDRINAALEAASESDPAASENPLVYTGSTRIFHLAEYLIDEVGIGAVASHVKRPLNNMRIAVHYGCHMLRPQPAIRWDDALHPTKFEALLAALGARIVDYPSKMQCCGGALDRVGSRDTSLAFAQRKLNDLKNNDVDALIVACPSCFLQFDLNQAALARAKEAYDIPVFFLSEILALTFGYDKDELGLSSHKISVEPFFEKWDAAKEYNEHLARHFDVALLNKCNGCRACKDDCPVGKIDPTFRPNDLIQDLVEGRMDEAVASGEAFKCVECFNCQELCHSRIGMANTMRILKNLGVARGLNPASVTESFEVVLKEGTLGKPRANARKKLGLGDAPASGEGALAEVLAALNADFETKQSSVADESLVGEE